VWNAIFSAISTAEALARELLLRPIGNTVYFMPPYVLTDAEFELLVARVGDILDRV
jgi:adenosylmethionine-8-amino-7-oxononanoate aminotransferase